MSAYQVPGLGFSPAFTSGWVGELAAQVQTSLSPLPLLNDLGFLLHGVS